MTVDLNADQRRAAECLERPVLVTAGAGSGKTRMLTQRFVNAVVPPSGCAWAPADVDQIVAITFTDKAAGEIAQRVRLALQSAGRAEEARRLGNAWISTIHGMCSRVLRRHPLEAGVDPLFGVADTIQTGRLRERAFEEAAREVADASAEGAALFDRYEFDALFSACVAIDRQLGVLGLGAGDMDLEDAESGQQLAAEAQALFTLGMTTCDLGYSGTSSDPDDHVIRCEELLGRCSVLASAGHEEAQLLDELLTALEAYRPLKKLKGLEALAAELVALKQDLTGRVAAAIVAPHADALKRLVTAYTVAYSDKKAAAGLLDYDDLQVRAVRLLDSRPDIAMGYRSRFRVVMVDEFQDTDALQLRLVESISEDNLCTVGDQNQSIYRFRGADVDVYRMHRARMAQAGAFVAELDVNYRSHPDVLGFVNCVFGSDEYFGEELLMLRTPAGDRSAGLLDGVLGDRSRVEVVFVDSSVDGRLARLAEAKTVALRLSELCDSGAKAGQMAILLRSYSHAHDYAEALSSVGMSAVVVGGSRFFGLPEIAVMRALNRAIANLEDQAALGVLLASDFVAISTDALAMLRLGRGARDSRSLWELLQDLPDGLSAIDAESIARLVDVLGEAADRVGSAPLADVLLLAVERTGWDLRLFSQGNVGRDAFANVLKFLRQAAAFEGSGGSGPAGFAAHLDTKERLGDTEAPASLADDSSDAVRIMSIHASKGLEFPIVVVPELATRGRGDALSVRMAGRGEGLAVALKTPPDDNGEARTPSRWVADFSAIDDEADAEESARVLYVACTRAQEFLLVSGSMGLQTKKPTSARHHLARLSRILGVQNPVSGPSDNAVFVLGTEVGCRVRVVDPAQVAGVGPDEPAETDDLPLPPDAKAIVGDPERRRPPERLSYTQFSEFEHCPKRYWVKRVLGVGNSETSYEDGVDPIQFGTALHTALRLVSGETEAPSYKQMRAITRFFELSEEGAARLGQAVERYCGSELARRADRGDVVRRESPFAMHVGGRFLLTGSIDLFSSTGDCALILDYKSGSAGEAAELGERYLLQAECYAMAVLRDGCESVDIVFMRPEVVDESGSIQQTAFTFAAHDADRIEDELIARYEEICGSAFEARPSQQCERCDVAFGLCPHVPVRRL